MFLAFAGVFLSVLVWWLCIRPSHDRHWRPEVAVMPRAIVDGDRVLLVHNKWDGEKDRYAWAEIESLTPEKDPFFRFATPETQKLNSGSVHDPG